MELSYDAKQVQHLAELHQEQARLRALARSSMVWGIIIVLIGVSGLSDSLLNIVIIVIGSFDFLQGVWFNTRPSPAGLLVDGLVLFVIAAWDFSLVALELWAGVPPSPLAANFGLVCLGFALYRFFSFPRSYQLFQEPIAKDDLQHMDKLIRYLSKTNPKGAADIIALQMRQKQWRTYLGPHFALFLDVARKKVMVAQRGNVSIEERGKVLMGSTLKVRIQIYSQRWDGLMSPAAFAKFQAWKLSDEADAVSELPQPSSSDAYKRRDQIQ